MVQPRTRDHQEYLLESLQDPEEASAYLNAALEENDNEFFFLALKNVVQATAMLKGTQKANLNRENLYRMLSKKGNPDISNLRALLGSIGLEISIKPANEPNCLSEKRVSDEWSWLQQPSYKYKTSWRNS